MKYPLNPNHNSFNKSLRNRGELFFRSLEHKYTSQKRGNAKIIRSASNTSEVVPY